MKRFFTKFAFGNHFVMDKLSGKKVVGYSTKADAEKTTAGLNRIRIKANIEIRIKSLKTTKGYSYYTKKTK